MDPLGIISPVIIPAQPAATSSAQNAPALPLPVPAPSNNGGQADYVDIQAAEQQRYEAVRKAAQDIANIYIVSDTRFTIYKDVTGQYITRFTSLRDGKVTYIPEPELFKRSQSQAPSLLTIKV